MRLRFAAAVMAATALVLLAHVSARADEGMWTLDAFPSEKVAQAYGFAPDQAWLDHVRLSALRLARGCSASFVSARGLVQTNHHCALACVQQLSSAGRDYVTTGFYAARDEDELRCPAVEANQLLAIVDVTERINAAVAGKDGAAFTDAMKAVKAEIARDCAGGDPDLRCDVVELYHGAIYNLYKYRRYQDLRLVFAPEIGIAFFGGDLDNFEFPRYALDVAYMRVYLNGKPLDTGASFLRYAAADARPGDLTFTAGHPGATNRLDTVAQLQFRRDVALPRDLLYLAEEREALTEFARRGAEEARISTGALFGVGNSFKAKKGQLDALVDPAIIAERTKAEHELRARLQSDPRLRTRYGAAWDAVAAAVERDRVRYDRYVFTEGGRGFESRLFGLAKVLVRHAAEARKPQAERLAEYTDANFPILRQTVTSPAPIYPQLERLTLAFSLAKLRETLGPDDPFVKKVLAGKSPEARAAELVDGTALTDVGLCTRLLDADPATIAASRDSMLTLARSIDPDLRAIRQEHEDDVATPLAKNAGLIARARFEMFGRAIYPDATFTLRISYGAVAGYRDGGKDVDPITRIGGLFARASGIAPFRLPPSWIAARPDLGPNQPLDFVTTNDIIGGNSGSPMINRAAEVVGVVFDGNRQSLGGAFGYDPSVNRAIAVSVGAIRMALAKVYHADRLVDELSH